MPVGQTEGWIRNLWNVIYVICSGPVILSQSYILNRDLGHFTQLDMVVWVSVHVWHSMIPNRNKNNKVQTDIWYCIRRIKSIVDIASISQMIWIKRIHQEENV